MRRLIALLCTVSAAGVPPAAAEFVPGRLYLSGIVGLCPDEIHYDFGIYEFDPQTRDWRIFAEMPEGLCGRLAGLTFTPDYSRLRISSYGHNSILELDGAGNVSVALGPEDGIAAPLGGNNIAYGPNGDFYVGNGGWIMRYPADGGPGEVFADQFDGINGSGPLSLAPDGTVYYGASGGQSRQILRFTPEGEASVFDTLPEGHQLSSLVLDDAGNMFAATAGGMYRYLNQDAATRTQLNDLYGDHEVAALSLSADQSILYQISVNRLRAIDTVTGETTLLSFVPYDNWVGYGMAFYVPEPGGLFVLVAFAVCKHRFSRSAPHL